MWQIRDIIQYSTYKICKALLHVIGQKRLSTDHYRPIHVEQTAQFVVCPKLQTLT